MATREERQRVAAAMKPRAAEGALARPPGDDDIDDDLLASGDGPTAEEVSDWKSSPATIRAVGVLRKRYVAQAKKLLAEAEGSTDPRVAAQGARLKELQSVIVAMGGKAG